MILVDTSAWIDLFRRRESRAATKLSAALASREACSITPLVMQELLQGAADEREYKLLDSYLSSQPMLYLHAGTQSYRCAAKLYFDCRRAGHTIRSSNDCLIAQIALEHGATLLHNDRDFDAIAKIAPKLKLA